MLVLVAVAATRVKEAKVDIQTLWNFTPSRYHNAGSGNWWGPTFARTKRGTLLLAALGKVFTCVSLHTHSQDFFHTNSIKIDVP